MTAHTKRLQKLEGVRKAPGMCVVHWQEEKGYWIEIGKEDTVTIISEEDYKKLSLENHVMLVKYLKDKNGEPCGQIIMTAPDKL